MFITSKSNTYSNLASGVESSIYFGSNELECYDSEDALYFDNGWSFGFSSYEFMLITEVETPFANSGVMGFGRNYEEDGLLAGPLIYQQLFDDVSTSPILY